MALVSESSETG